MALTVASIRNIVAEIAVPGVALLVHAADEALDLQIEVAGRCNTAGTPMTWRGRKWRLSRHMTKSEIVQTAFLAVLTATEHEVREQFTYRGAAVFGPHFSVDRLVTLAGDPLAIDVRPDP